MSDSKNLDLKNEYEYGFHDEDVSVYKTEKGLKWSWRTFLTEPGSRCWKQFSW